MKTLVPKILIGEDSLQALTELTRTRSFSSVWVLVDENTLKHCYPRLIHFLPQHHLLQITSGEVHKTLASCELIWNKLSNHQADRQSLLVNLGGGVIGDLGGFAAGCYKRGISFVNIPTTLLAMVDASVGAKTGIDWMGYKNQIGLFAEPETVLVYPAFLNTLPHRELVSGWAEVIKHYLIADAAAFADLSQNLQPLSAFNWPEVVKKNIAVKSHFVSQDPHEKGIRKALNFGHTIGHAAESYFLTTEHQKLLHGEAVAIGMICESYISSRQNHLSASDLDKIVRVILHYFSLPLLPSFDLNKLLQLMKQDKKNDAQQSRFTLLNQIGNYSINNYVEEEVILDSMNYYNSLLA